MSLPFVSLPLPSIFTANTYYWQSAKSASARRYNENRRLSEAEAWFSQIADATVTRNDSSVTCEFTRGKDAFVVEFSYSESRKNVYKHLSTTRNGKKSNISTVKKALQIS